METITKTTLRQAIDDGLPPGTRLKLSRTHYQEIGVNQKRFSAILKGKIDPTVAELKNICNFFRLNPVNFL